MMKNRTYALSGIASALQYALTNEEFEKITDLLQDAAQEKLADLDDQESLYGFRDGIKNSYADLVYDLGEAMSEKEQERINSMKVEYPTADEVKAKVQERMNPYSH